MSSAPAPNSNSKPSPAPQPQQQAQPAVTFLDNPLAPEFFVDGVAGVFNYNGVVRVTFEAGRVNHVTSPGPVNRVVNVRLAMTVPGAQALAAGLYDFLKKQGLDPVPTPPTDKLQ